MFSLLKPLEKDFTSLKFKAFDVEVKTDFQHNTRPNHHIFVKHKGTLCSVN